MAFLARSAASVWNLSRCSIEYDVMPISLSGKSAKSPVSAMAMEYLCTRSLKRSRVSFAIFVRISFETDILSFSDILRS